MPCEGDASQPVKVKEEFEFNVRPSAWHCALRMPEHSCIGPVEAACAVQCVSAWHLQAGAELISKTTSWICWGGVTATQCNPMGNMSDAANRLVRALLALATGV